MKRLGKILVEAGILEESDLATLLEVQRSQGGRLGTLALESQRLDEKQVQSALGQQLRLEVAQAKDLRRIPPVVLDAVPRALATDTGVIPFRVLGREVFVAVKDKPSTQDSKRLQEETGCEIRPFIALEARHHVALAEFYGAPAAQRFYQLCRSLDRAQPARGADTHTVAESEVTTASLVVEPSPPPDERSETETQPTSIPSSTNSTKPNDESSTDSLELIDVLLEETVTDLAETNHRDEAADRLIDFLNRYSEKVALLKPSEDGYEHWMSEGLQVLTSDDLPLSADRVLEANGRLEIIAGDLPHPQWQQTWNPSETATVVLEPVSLGPRTVAIVAFEDHDALTEERVDRLLAAFTEELKRYLYERRA